MLNAVVLVLVIVACIILGMRFRDNIDFIANRSWTEMVSVSGDPFSDYDYEHRRKRLSTSTMSCTGWVLRSVTDKKISGAIRAFCVESFERRKRHER